MDKSYRIHTDISKDTILNVNMKQDFDFLEVLSLKLSQKDAYKLHSSNYGVIVGRILANDAFGIPNAKVSVFIERDNNDTTELENIYPYTEVTSKDRNNVRYNLLPDESTDECYRIVGTFPSKRLVLDDNSVLEVYEKYWKYTTVTNNAGDYMLFGIPVGSQQVHTDLDLSDIGILSQKPRDFLYKGYTMTEFDNANQFKESTNLDSLRQIISQNKSVYVYPFWGDNDNGIAAITRCDMDIDYKFEPTCVFMGSIVSDNESNAIGHNCSPSVDNGMNPQLTAGEGTIEMIRKTTDGFVEEYQIQGNRLIDSDGVWCYQIPMNLDYIGTDEYGNVVPTDNPQKGLPTRTRVRFRFSKSESGDEAISRHTAKYLVPMNPPLDEESIAPKSALNGKDFEKQYNFGSNTPENCFRDLYWNNVYSVKNYIPKAQVANKVTTSYYTGLKGSNLVDNQNPIPFNKLRIDIPFMFVLICIIMDIITYAVWFINFFIVNTINLILEVLNDIADAATLFTGIGDALIPDPIGCIGIGGGAGRENYGYFPGCMHAWYKYSDCPESAGENCKKDDDIGDLKDSYERSLSLDYKIVKLDLYQDWINGCLYMPLWYWRKRKKKSYLFGLITRSAKNEFCDCSKVYGSLKLAVGCNITYTSDNFTVTSEDNSSREDSWHKNKYDSVWFPNGLIKGVKNKDNLTVYYYTAMQPTWKGRKYIPITERNNFDVVRLFATDIILLGNLNEDNLYGIPQVFKSLPSTTANVPPIASVKENIGENEEERTDTMSKSDFNLDYENEGDVIITGMDFGHDGDEDAPTYKNGMLIDFNCTYAGTLMKSCINVERMSEYGVNPDMAYRMIYSKSGSETDSGIIYPDGFINKYELDDLDNRSAFATLNHIGFMPTTTVNGYSTQVLDENTNYYVPKFQYLFPTDFDGRAKGIMKRYKHGWQQAFDDVASDAYITFRMGGEHDGVNGRTRHFYHEYSMPLYNNSFYFYFGINKGKTAIEKFTNMFLAECVKNKKYPFSLDIEKQGRSYCPSAYKDDIKAKAYAYVKFTSDDIQMPYSYTLYDSLGSVVIREEDLIASSITIGNVTKTEDQNNNITWAGDGKVYYHDREGNQTNVVTDNDFYANGLTNQIYNLVVTDVNGKTVRERINLDVEPITLDVKSMQLGAKFYNTESTSRDYICGDNQYNGKILLSEITIDGISCYIDRYMYTDIHGDGSEYEFTIVVSNSTYFNQGTTVSLTLSYDSTSEEDVQTVKDCCCLINNTIRVVDYYYDDPEDESETPSTKLGIQVDVYKPSSFKIFVQQCCENCCTSSEKVCENKYNTTVYVSNGENFNAFLNTMPVRFMIGNNSDTNNYFYNRTGVTSATDTHICGWYGVHQEDSYLFNREENKTKESNSNLWFDLANIGDNITTADGKLDVVMNKFNWMFGLSNAVYQTSDFTFSAIGGIQPILYRSVVPMYYDSDTMFNYFTFDDTNYGGGDSTYPSIIANNYMGAKNEIRINHTFTFNIGGASVEFNQEERIKLEENKPYLNFLFKDSSGGSGLSSLYRQNNYIGNYFAAFTNNGGYVNSKTLDSNLVVARVPNQASVSPYHNSTPKQIGKVKEDVIANFKLAHTEGYQTLRGDIARTVKPYLRAMSVDRRLDYELVIFAPFVGEEFKLYDNEEYDKMWKNARISGITYGGIEMAYDERYNVISATSVHDDEGGLVSANPSSLLEYTYSGVSNGNSNAITVYNYASGNTQINPRNIIWEEDKRQDGTWEVGKTLNKRFYEAYFGDTDIKNFFWSTFNKERLKTYTNSQENRWPCNSYVFKYPYNSNDMSLYNGDFNRLNVLAENGNYPTKRFIDVGNIEASTDYELKISSCSYGSIKVDRDENDNLEAIIGRGETVDLDIDFESPFEFMLRENDDDSLNPHATVEYGRDSLVNGVLSLRASKTALLFRIARRSNSKFNIYPKLPISVLKVLPLNNSFGRNLDGISYVKLFNTNNETGVNYGSYTNVDAAISGNTTFRIGYVGDCSVQPPFIIQCDDLSAPDEYKLYNGFYDKNNNYIDGKFIYYFANNRGKAVTSNSSLIDDAVFYKEVPLNNAEAFCLLLESIYISKSKNRLINRIKMYETSEIIDSRPITIEAINEPDYTYTEVISDNPCQFNDTITFKITINNDGNQVFRDFQYLSFECRIRLIDWMTHQLLKGIGSVEGIESSGGITKFYVKCFFENGIDTSHSINPDDNEHFCSLIATTSSNISYRLGSFKVKIIKTNCSNIGKYGYNEFKIVE